MAWTVLTPMVRKDFDLARCDCGTVREVRRNHRMSGRSTSCGCVARRLASARAKHRGVGTRLYGIYANMRQRCLNSDNPKFHRYGGRGITICDEWMDFVIFREWAESHGYADDLTIDRIDNDAGYSPGNCRWTDRHTQALNREATALLPDGRIGFMVAEKNGINAAAFQARVRLGWSVERACTQPLRRSRR